MNGLGQWTREASRGEPDLRCRGCRRRPADREVRIDGEAVRLCERCARVRAVDGRGRGARGERGWVVVVTTRSP